MMENQIPMNKDNDLKFREGLLDEELKKKKLEELNEKVNNENHQLEYFTE